MSRGSFPDFCLPRGLRLGSRTEDLITRLIKLCKWILFHGVRFVVQGLKLYPIDLLFSTGLSIDLD